LRFNENFELLDRLVLSHVLPLNRYPLGREMHELNKTPYCSVPIVKD